MWPTPSSQSMRNSSIVFLVLLTLSLASCSKKAKIDGTLSGVSGGEVVVRLLDVNKFQTLDTLTTDASGRFSFKADVKAGQPEFIYLYYGSTKVASLLLRSGDKVRVTSDTLGTYSVTGSEETALLMEVEKDEEQFQNKMASIAARIEDLDPSSSLAAQLRAELSREYVRYYRDRVKYILTNPYSLTVIPVLYQSVGEDLPVFGQVTDAIHFRNACDSLLTVYPESKYVKALDEEASRRQNYLDLSTRVGNASEAGFPDVGLPDIGGQKVMISDLDAKVVMVYFWTEVDSHKMQNLDLLQPLYDKYHSKGLEIYSVCLHSDKTEWANVVRSQKLPWVNVCDGKGTGSPAVLLYNVTKVPVAYFIVDGELRGDKPLYEDKEIKDFLAKTLK